MPTDPEQPVQTPTRRAAIKLILAAAAFPMTAACAAAPVGRAPATRQPIARPAPNPEPFLRPWQPLDSAAVDRLRSPELAGVRHRSEWASGSPVPSLMDRLPRITRLTVHHDGMSTFASTSSSAAASRIERIRRAHRGRGWGDIGYHYVVDPAGRVWAARPLAYQGAHVRNHNEQNVGVCVLGNYMKQSPNASQEAALAALVASVMRANGLSTSNVHTHRELGATACPGNSLQRVMDRLRSPQGTLASV